MGIGTLLPTLLPSTWLPLDLIQGHCWRSASGVIAIAPLDFWGKQELHQKSPKIIWGYFRVSYPTNPKIDYYNSCFPQKSRVEIAIAPLALLQQCPWIRSKGNHAYIDGSSVGNRVPIPVYPRLHPSFSGKEQGQVQGLKTNWGFFGDRDNPKFGDLLGFIPKKPRISGMGFQLLRCLGTLWGWGNPKFWGFMGKNPQKSPNFGVGTGEGLSGIFTPLV